MKFSVAAVAGLFSAVSAASLPAAFTLVAEGGLTVLTDGQYLYYGGNGTDASKDIAIFHATPDTGAVSYTAKDSTPTGWQNLYVVEKDTAPVGLTRPHSGAVPEGASTIDFSVDEKGLFAHGGNAYFAVEGYGDNPVKTVYWYGRHSSTYRAADLYVKECKGC
ncbi:hypothetical protein ABOM_009894 [Aspergillus bombycis]|uniref:Uncharacterized protein n=1 Tax=Aspergillus bombycis TaxID=109264 RepID=A0A1F7ZQI0_9EURO|nr:hypothetical protein ABOM_009894 [Aspergillus bombycis]OGM41716.1 hypothetical protein ABOM_009894 [Aspergillus bombycis]